VTYYCIFSNGRNVCVHFTTFGSVTDPRTDCGRRLTQSMTFKDHPQAFLYYITYCSARLHIVLPITHWVNERWTVLYELRNSNHPSETERFLQKSQCCYCYSYCYQATNQFICWLKSNKMTMNKNNHQESTGHKGRWASTDDCPKYKEQGALLMQRNRASTLSVEIV